MSFRIAIDGPAGAGKSTAARQAARELNFVYVDTGALYRTIALGLLRRGIRIEPQQEKDGALPDSVKKKIEEVLPEIEVGIRYEDGQQQVFLNGEQVSALIRTEEVSRMTSISSALPSVREKLTGLQKQLAKTCNVVMDGRDIGTQILPDAQLKIYLTASVSARAMRRCKELEGKGEQCSLSEIEQEIEARDYRDMHRETAPLRQAEDAVLIDSSDLGIAEVTGRIVALARKRGQMGDFAERNFV